MDWMTTDDPIHALEMKVLQMHEELAKLRRSAPEIPVDDFGFQGWDGPTRLSQLFGGRDELLVVHNMGQSCAYCTLWADGFNGLVDHIESRSAFVVVSPDPVDAQREFAAGRSWRFRIVSDPDRTFTDAMGFLHPQHGVYPGVSSYRKGDDGAILRKNRTVLGPFDEFCAVWSLLSLLPNGVDGWSPSFSYRT